jgi:hypothetical protein
VDSFILNNVKLNRKAEHMYLVLYQLIQVRYISHVQSQDEITRTDEIYKMSLFMTTHTILFLNIIEDCTLTRSVT